MICILYMFTFKYNIYCAEKKRNKFKVDKIIFNENKKLILIDNLYMNSLEIRKLFKYIKYTDIQII